MKKQFTKYDDFSLFFGDLTRRQFEESPVWCEYHEPSELVSIEKSGVPMEWLNDNLLNVVRKGEAPYYSFNGFYDYSKCEFYYVLCDVSFLEHKMVGYACVVSGKVNSIAVFLDGDDVADFFASDLLDDENTEALGAIFNYLGVKKININRVAYQLRVESMPGLKLKDDFSFPIEEKKGSI